VAEDFWGVTKGRNSKKLRRVVVKLRIQRAQVSEEPKAGAQPVDCMLQLLEELESCQGLQS
jgi:hypothetical protein